ncbi:RDD family protein [Rugosimonospora africana]|uniref:RDD family protein n=1 Tax=Rugosimonospora africana TaxID=556532 RepID=UPI001EF393F9|nr:RDD family protein [Rugosimonospora africana]
MLTVRVSLNAPENDGLRLFSGDAVELDIRIARLGSRALARLIDLVAQIVLTVLVSGLLSVIIINVESNPDDAILQAEWIITLVVVLIGYPTLLESRTAGRTLGKLVMGLRVIRDDGGPVRFRHALTRALVGIAVEFPALGTGVALPIGWLISIWTMLVNPLGKRVGDLAAGTIVIHDRTPASWGWVPAMPPQLAGWAATLDLTGLDDDLALTVRHYLARNRELREPARSRLGYALASEVAECTTPEVPPGTPGWAYLAAVLAERNRRSAQRLMRTRLVTDRIWPELSRAVRVAQTQPVWPVALPAPPGIPVPPGISLPPGGTVPPGIPVPQRGPVPPGSPVPSPGPVPPRSPVPSGPPAPPA